MIAFDPTPDIGTLASPPLCKPNSEERPEEVKPASEPLPLLPSEPHHRSFERKTKLYPQSSKFYLAIHFYKEDGDVFAVVMSKSK